MGTQKKRTERTCPKTGQSQVQSRSLWLLWLMPITGFLALLWFLIRVIPKPSRATYPCQRVAFPLASGFVIWIMGVVGSIAAMKKARFLLKNGRCTVALFFIAVGVCAIYLPLSHNGLLSFGDNDGDWYVPADPPLEPNGVPGGIHPGRVVWTYNPDATTWDGKTGKWWENIDQSQVDQMLSDVLVDLVEAANDVDAWDGLFRYFNQSAGKDDIGYQSGEKVVVKLNLNRGTSHSSNNNQTVIAPQVVLSLLQQLVYNAGVDDSCITFYDASRYVPDTIYDRCKAEFPDVHFADLSGGDGREQVQKDYQNQMHWSDDLQDPTEEGGSSPAYLPTCVTSADYFINVASLKGHTLAGVTVCGKNHFGSFIADPPEGDNVMQMPKNAGLHPYVAVHTTGTSGGRVYEKRPMGSYNPLVDLMGHAHLGGKTMLYLVDGLYAANYQSDTLAADCKWQSKPFCDDDGWTSSLFASQDPVAIDSVALDFICAEPAIQEYPKIMNSGDTVDNYLHEAARADNPPSGAFYDPEGDCTAMDSLGVHEHWKDSIKKQYSGNLKTAEGIELIRSPRLLGDINGGGVDFEDMDILTSNWQADDCNEANQWRNGADINRDGIVNLLDFAHLGADWQKYIIEK